MHVFDWNRAPRLAMFTTYLRADTKCEVLGASWTMARVRIALLLGAMWNGGFDLIPDPPPYFQAPYEDRSLLANQIWALAIVIVYVPFFLIPALAIWKWRERKGGSDS